MPCAFLKDAAASNSDSVTPNPASCSPERQAPIDYYKHLGATEVVARYADDDGKIVHAEPQSATHPSP
jgi:hypothetical protein